MKRVLLIFCAIFTGISAIATDYANNLLKMDAYKNSNGQISLDIYTSQPYKDTLVVNPKGNNTYVLYLPEVKNSMSQKPQVSAGNIIKNIDVKTQNSVAPGGKGYTKITFTTSESVQIIARAKVVPYSEKKITDNEVKNLVSEAKKVTTAKKVVQKSNIESNVKNKNITKTVQKKSEKLLTKPASKELVKNDNKVVRKEQKNDVVSEKNTSQKNIQKEQSSVTKANKMTEQNNNVKENDTNTQEEVLDSEQDTSQKVLSNSTPIQQNNNTQVKKMYKINPQIITILIVLLIPVALILIIFRYARKMVQQIKEHKKQFKDRLDETPQNPVETHDDIIENEDLSWKDKYESYKNAKNIEDVKVSPQILNKDIEEDLDELFVADSEDISSDEINDSISFGEQLQNVEQNVEEKDEDIENIFADNDSILEVNQDIIKVSQENENIEKNIVALKSEAKIDENKGFYLVDVEDKTSLVGYIDENIFVIKQFDGIENSDVSIRIYEKNTFFVKVGSYKALVNVSENSMEKTLEL